MLSSRLSKALAAGLATVVFVGMAGDAFAKINRYSGTDITRFDRTHRQYRRGGINPGAAIAGAALGIAGAAAVGVGANRYYNGYPAYGYGDNYGPRYGYDYIPEHGYYGPY